MEMAIDREDFDFEVIEDDDIIPAKKTNRLCPHCSSEVTGRPNKIFCTSNCRKRHSEPKRNSTAAQRSVEKTRSFLIEH
ncbi:MAG: hypothetical protein P8L40_00470 [Planktomarina sp.]|nr:hypothetical protein [Planktomarina sp.]